MKNLYNAVLCRYDEIAIKGNNRPMFEKCLVENMKHILKGINELKISRVRGRIWMEKKDSSDFTEAELDMINNGLPKVFGLESFSPGIVSAPELNSIKEKIKKSCVEKFDELFKTKKIISFRSRVRRSDKKFPVRSKELEIDIASMMAEIYGDANLKIDLENPEISIGCEIREEFAFIFYDIMRGPGGLPVGSNAQVLALLSGGIDSPVACYLAMKRGCPLSYITFHSFPYTPQDSVEKVKRLMKILNSYQKYGVLFSCNLSPIQKIIRDKCEPRYRTVLYRRMMLRIAEKIAKSRNYYALLTGEAIGQVASQTVINMNTINNAIDTLVLRPLLGMDKQENIRMAEKIGTYNISKEETPDSCTVFAPPSPATGASIEAIIEEEEKIGDFQAVLNEIVEKIEVFKPDME